MVSVTVPVAPLTRLTRITSAITPMMMPSIVRNARILLPLMLLSAMRRDCIRESAIYLTSVSFPSRICTLRPACAATVSSCVMSTMVLP